MYRKPRLGRSLSSTKLMVVMRKFRILGIMYLILMVKERLIFGNWKNIFYFLFSASNIK